MLDDSAAFLADFGLPVVFGAHTGLGILDRPDLALLGGMQLSTDYALTVRTADFPGLKSGDALTVAGVAYRVREAKAHDDGIFTVAALSHV